MFWITLDYIGFLYFLNFVFSWWNSYLEPYAVIVFYGYAAWSILISIQFPYLLISLGLARASNHDMPQCSVLNSFVKNNNIFLIYVCIFSYITDYLICLFFFCGHLQNLSRTMLECFALNPIYFWYPICWDWITSTELIFVTWVSSPGNWTQNPLYRMKVYHT